MTSTPVQVVEELLTNTTNPDKLKTLVAKDATYVSVSYSNPDLKKIMLWCGTHAKAGPQAIIDTFTNVGEHWANENFEVEAVFGSGENIAVFGRFTYRSRTLQKAATSPFAIWCKVVDGQVSYMQFMEDTFGTAATFRSGGQWTFESDPKEG